MRLKISNSWKYDLSETRQDYCSDDKKDWTLKDQNNDKDQSHKDKDNNKTCKDKDKD